jgi:hypothetical protein
LLGGWDLDGNGESKRLKAISRNGRSYHEDTNSMNEWERYCIFLCFLLLVALIFLVGNFMQKKD